MLMMLAVAAPLIEKLHVDTRDARYHFSACVKGLQAHADDARSRCFSPSDADDARSPSQSTCVVILWVLEPLQP